LLSATLLFCGLAFLFTDEIYEGQILVFLSVILVCCRNFATRRIIWIAQEVHRLLSTLLMLGVMGVEAAMHFLNIPHLEGWWMPIIGGGAFASVIASFVQKWRRKLSKDTV
jgi:hypothetical protein